MAISRESEGWHTYTLRKRIPARPRSAMRGGLDALLYPAMWLIRMAGDPWRRLTALYRSPGA